jgi:hypothetical protein
VCGEDLVAAHIGDKDRVGAVFLESTEDLRDRHLTVEIRQGVCFCLLLQPRHPVGVRCPRKLLDQLAQDVVGIAHDGDKGLDVLSDLGGVDVDVDDLGLGREVQRAAGGPVAEPRRHADDDVGPGDSGVGGDAPVVAVQAEVQRV